MRDVIVVDSGRGRARHAIYRLNPVHVERVQINTPLAQATRKRGFIRSHAAAQLLQRTVADIESEMHQLAETGDAILCIVSRPGQPAELEMRLSGDLPTAANFRIKAPPAEFSFD
jgi:hypothetical protein